MSAITNQANLKVETGGGEKLAIYRVPNVTTGDTMALSADFYKIKIATQVVAGSTATAAQPTIAGTTLTFAAAALANDTLYVMVLGDAK